MFSDNDGSETDAAASYLQQPELGDGFCQAQTRASELTQVKGSDSEEDEQGSLKLLACKAQ